MAWLSAKPTPDKPALNGPELLSRLEKLRGEGKEPDLPPLSAPWVVDKLMEIGPIVAAGMGAGPIGWRDITAWQEVTGFTLEPWEARLIRKLSTEYLTVMTDARKADCPPPWSPVDPGDERATVGKKVQNAFRAMMAPRKQS